MIIVSAAYQCGCVTCNHDRWLSAAKDDDAGQFFVVKADNENQAIAELAELVGLNLAG